MQNAFYLKEPISFLDKNVLLVLLSQKQLKEGVEFSMNSILSKKDMNLILISLTTPGTELLKKANSAFAQNLGIIDSFSEEKSNSSQIQYCSPGDFTGIQIASEKFEQKLTGQKTILIDALNVLSVYNKKNALGKFLHLFSNKTRLRGDSAIVFCVKESSDPEVVEMMKEFADKIFDYSDIFVSAVKLAEER